MDEMNQTEVDQNVSGSTFSTAQRNQCEAAVCRHPGFNVMATVTKDSLL